VWDSSDSTRLAQALAGQQALIDQATRLGVFVAGCAVWRISPLNEPEPFVLFVVFVGLIALVVELAILWVRHEDVVASSDDLILAGFFGDARRTPIERAVSHRLSSIEKPRVRRRLADALRWRLRLADGTARLSPGYIRASAFPPLSRSQRRAILDERPLVTEMADRVQQRPVDPRALVILWGFVTLPPHLDPQGDQRTYEELRGRLQKASALIMEGTAATPGAGRNPQANTKALSPTRNRR
jgi:hypothetical protein